MRSFIENKSWRSERKDSKQETKDASIKQMSKIVSLLKESKISALTDLPDKKERKVLWAEMMQGYILIERQLKFKLNFDMSIFEIIREVYKKFLKIFSKFKLVKILTKMYMK